MNKSRHEPDSFGPYHGVVSPAFDAPDFRERLGDLPGLLARSEPIQTGRNQLFRCKVRTGGQFLDLAVKKFGLPSFPARTVFRNRRSKARRSWEAAGRLFERDRLTPEPVAYLERSNRPFESVFIARYSRGRISFREALNRVYRYHPDCGALMSLLQTVADGIRSMHDAGLVHRDPGNQNILLRPTGPFIWDNPQFIDLNRARLRRAVSPRERARDLSRVTLPSDLRRILFQMYYGGPPPEAFLRWERHYRARFAWHTRTRAWRHPFRERRIPREEPYPAPREFWIWDERSGQAINVWTARDRRRLHPHGAYLGVGKALAKSLPSALRAYSRYRQTAFRQPVSLAGRIGVAVQARPETLERERGFLRTLGTPPVLVRFYHHETESAWRQAARAVARLREDGCRVTISLVQDRRAVTDPARWRAFLSGVMEKVHDSVEAVEIGHAINRAKWGVWSPAEYRALMKPAAEIMSRYPKLDWLGPAGIDAEFPRVLALLHALPDGVRFSALSQHLYVDRRGAPENRQGLLATLEKVAAARAMGAASGRCADRLVISEVNWPLSGTGVYSPVCSPYMYPGQVVEAPNVSEAEAAHFMIRYFLITLCSGLAERVFWWRLAAHGYGLVDDRRPGGWRPRPAYRALAFFLKTSGNSRFLRKLSAPEGVHAWLFEANGKGHVWAYAHPLPVRYRPRFSYADRVDVQGRPVGSVDGTLLLSETPVLFSNVPPNTF